MTLCAEAAINIPISFWLFLWSFLDQNERVGTTVRKKNLWDWARSWNTKFIYIKKNDILLREAIKNGFIWYPLKKRFGTRKVIFPEMFNQKGVKYAIKKNGTFGTIVPNKTVFISSVRSSSVHHGLIEIQQQQQQATFSNFQIWSNPAYIHS